MERIINRIKTAWYVLFTKDYILVRIRQTHVEVITRTDGTVREDVELLHQAAEILKK